MRHRHPPFTRDFLPRIWLISDVRIDASLAGAIDRLPRGSGFVFRHYHLPPAERRARFRALARLARRRGHLVALSGTSADAARWGANAVYGPPGRLARGPRILRLVTVHSLRDLGQANRSRADLVLLSPVFTTCSHPGARPMGAVRFRLLAARACVPVIALGGMDAARARTLGTARWAAIESLAQPRIGAFPIHS